MREESSIAKGSAMGTRDRAAYPKNSKRTDISSPFPTISSTYFHKNCISTMNRHTKNVAKNAPR
jgi:hypothetical protein